MRHECDYSALAVRGAPAPPLSRVLGDMVDLIPSLFSAAGEVTKRGVEYKMKKDADEKAQRDSASALAAVIAADQKATEAAFRALASAATKSASYDADRLAADQAIAHQDEAGQGLSPDNQKKRVEAAKKAVADATAKWQAASAGKDEAKTAAAHLMVLAAQATLTKADNSAIVERGKKDPLADLPPPRGWLTRPVLGPVPGWGVLALGAVVLGGGGALAIKVLR